MLQHQTKIELKAEPTHDGTNDIIAAIIDKLGELTHGCAIITGCTMTIDWITGGTYQTHLEHVDIHDTGMWESPDGLIVISTILDMGMCSPQRSRTHCIP